MIAAKRSRRHLDAFAGAYRAAAASGSQKLLDERTIAMIRKMTLAAALLTAALVAPALSAPPADTRGLQQNRLRPRRQGQRQEAARGRGPQDRGSDRHPRRPVQRRRVRRGRGDDQEDRGGARQVKATAVGSKAVGSRGGPASTAHAPPTAPTAHCPPPTAHRPAAVRPRRAPIPR